MGKETYYKRKRKKSGLAKSDMAKELGIDYKKYNLIENGVVKMPSKLIDKFNEVVNKGKNEHMLNRLDSERVVNEFWDEMTTKVNNQYKLKEKMKEFNIITYGELAKLLGVSYSNLSHYLTGHTRTGYDFKNKLYLFFQDELNIQAPKKNNIGRSASAQGKNKQCNDPVLLEWFEKTDLKALVAKHGLKYEQIANETGMHVSCVSRNIRKDRNMVPSTKTLVALKKYFDDLEKSSANFYQVGPVEETESITTVASTNFEDFANVNIQTEATEKETQDDIIRRYQNELNDIEDLILIYEEKLREFHTRKRVCEEVLNVVYTIKGE